MDLTYFDELIKEADVYLSTLTTEDSRGVIHNLIVNYKGFRDRIKLKLKKRNFGDYQTSLKNFDVLAKKSKDELKASFKPIVNQARNQLDNIRFNYWHKSARSSGLENKVTRALDFLDNFYQQFSDGLESFEGQLYENNKLNMKRIIKEYGVSPMFKEFCNKVVNSLNKNFDGVVLKIDGLSAGIKIPNLSDTGLYHTRNFGTDSYDLVVKLEDVDNNFVKISSRGGYTHNSEDPQDAADYIALIARAIEKKSNDYRFNKKPNLPLQEKKMIVKTISAKTLKRELRESRERFALGLGFGDKPAYESNIDAQTKDYDRKIANSGGFGYGAGFKKMDESKMVEFVMEVVSSLKGKTEYHNLQFVNRIGGQYNLAEAKINTLKKVIKSDKTGLKVRKYVNESIAPEMYETYNEYNGLTNDSDVMISEIKKCFNKKKMSTGSVSEAVSMTSSELDIPMEMVQEMYDKLKESYETVMEGGTMDVNESLKGIYEKYRGMSEGSMDGLIDEIDDMMGYDEPRDSKEDGYNPFEEYDADNPEDNYDMFEEECLECDDELNEVDEYEPRGRKPYVEPWLDDSEDYDFSSEDDFEDDEQEFDFDRNANEFDGIYENKKKTYKYDTGLNVSANEALLGSKDMLREFNEALKNISKVIPIKVSSCGKYLKVENKIYYTRNGDLVSNVLSEQLLNERTWGEWRGDMAQGALSIGSMFIPGGGSLIEVLNAMIYFYRASKTSDQTRSDQLWTSGMISLVVAAMPTLLGGAGAAIKAFFIGGGKSFSKTLIKPLSGFLSRMSEYLPKLKLTVEKASKSTLAKKYLGTAASTISSKLSVATEATKRTINTLLGKVGAKKVAQSTAKATLTKLSSDKSIAKFFTGIGTNSLKIKNPIKLLTALGFTKGQKVAYITYGIKGQKNIVKGTIESVGSSVKIKLANGKIDTYPINVFINNAMNNPITKSYWQKVLTSGGNLVGGRFLGSFIFNNNGTEAEFKSTEDVSNFATELYANAEGVDVADYEGDTQNYTVKNEVSAVQTALQDVLGINVGSTGIDGKYGPATKEAIQNALDTSGFPMEAKMTAKSVIGIGVAILMKNGISGKAAVSELFNKAITDSSEVLNNANEIISSTKDKVDLMIEKLKALAGVTPRTMNATIAEGAFHETYKRMFG